MLGRMAEPSSRVTLIRHGETEWSLGGRHTGRTDIPLTEIGRQRAKQVGTRLAGQRFALVLTSPLQRAVETCRIAGLGDEAELTDDLREWDYGDYEGRRTVEIRAERPGWLLWRDGVPNGEAIDEVGRRVDRVIERVRAVDGDVALVAHGHVLRALAARWLDQPTAFGAHLRLETAAVSVVGWEREVPAVLLWNDQSHLV
jgi:broad specificity phosphatase PhoE